MKKVINYQENTTKRINGSMKNAGLKDLDELYVEIDIPKSKLNHRICVVRDVDIDTVKKVREVFSNGWKVEYYKHPFLIDKKFTEYDLIISGMYFVVDEDVHNKTGTWMNITGDEFMQSIPKGVKKFIYSSTIADHKFKKDYFYFKDNLNHKDTFYDFLKLIRNELM